MRVETVAVAGIVILQALALGCSAREESKPRESSGPVLGQENVLSQDLQLRPRSPAASGEPRETVRRRNAIEGLRQDEQVLLAIPLDDIQPTNTRPDGLLERSLSLEVKRVFVGEDPGAVVMAREIVAPLQVLKIDGTKTIELPRQDFMPRDGKARLVYISPCVEEDGRTLRVVSLAEVLSAVELAKFEEDARRYTPKSSEPPGPCKLGTAPLLERMLQVLHADL